MGLFGLAGVIVNVLVEAQAGSLAIKNKEQKSWSAILYMAIGLRRYLTSVGLFIEVFGCFIVIFKNNSCGEKCFEC
ncbi:hypothetical protein [Bacillus testis]|uniref:hypothetical protein n=1 Tax=Bacillus testis TaxID=1622072 RepID=UPI00067E71FD|nr:hypothetical protein [Bacillus testis]